MTRSSLTIGLGALIALGASGVQSQDAKKEYELAWKLPHGQVAVYEVFELPKKAKCGEFWLLGCELSGGRMAATQGKDLAYRFLFRLPKDKVRVGGKWDVQERAFADPASLIPPLEVRGSYVLKQVKKAKLDELLMSVPKGEKTEAVEVAVVEGQFEFFKCRWGNNRALVPDKKPAAGLTTTTVFRTSDGAIVGGRYQWRGRLEVYTGLNDASATQTDEAYELLLKEPLLELTSGTLKERIDRALERCVKWLKSKQQGEGKFGDQRGYPVGTSQSVGSTALSILALVHAGVKLDDGAVTSGYGYLAGKKSLQSYDIALELMAMEGKYLPLETLEDIKSFSEEKAREEIAKKLTKPDKALAEADARLLIERQGENGGFGYTENKGDTIVLSNTQYAILGLKSASRMGVAVPAGVWKRALAYVESGAVLKDTGIALEAQRYDGSKLERKSDAYGWSYRPGQSSIELHKQITGTMTTAALTIIAICRSELARAGEWTEERVSRIEKLEAGGLAWLQQNFSVRATPPEGCNNLAAMPYFYLYSLERACIVLGIEKIGGHDWYLEGAAILLSWQKPDGSWEGPHGTPVIDTAFALLFLKRATVPVMTPTGSGKKP